MESSVTISGALSTTALASNGARPASRRSGNDSKLERTPTMEVSHVGGSPPAATAASRRASY
jgi:hypothetical protein